MSPYSTLTLEASAAQDIRGGAGRWPHHSVYPPEQEGGALVAAFGLLFGPNKPVKCPQLQFLETQLPPLPQGA